MKKIKNIILLVVVIGLIVGGFSIYKNMKIRDNRETLTSKIEENISSLKELSTVSYNYTNIAEYKNNLQLSGIDIPFTKKTFLVKYSGYLKAGVDDLEIINLDDNMKKAKVIMARPKVFDNVIIEEEVYFYNEKDSAFNRLKFDELYEILKDEKVKTQDEIVEKGFLNDARDNAEKIITDYLYTLGYESVEFEIKD